MQTQSIAPTEAVVRQESDSAGDGTQIGHADAPTVVAALDIGGTKIAGAVADRHGVLIARAQRPTPAAGPSEAVMGAVDQVLSDLASAPDWQHVRCVGVASAGPIHATDGWVSPVNIPAWRDFPLLDRIRRHPAVRGLPVTLIGDGVAMTAAEHWLGAARGHRNVLGMVVSTGVGGGLVIDNSLHSGLTGNAGHIGHVTVDLDGAPCPCGSRGCVEGLASGTAIARRARLAGWRPTGGGDGSAAAVAQAARAGDPVALAIYERAAQALAAGIAAAATLVELDVAVIGGGVAQSEELLLGLLRRSLVQYAKLPFTNRIEVKAAALGADAGLVGAAAAALELVSLPGAAGPAVG